MLVNATKFQSYSFYCFDFIKRHYTRMGGGIKVALAPLRLGFKKIKISKIFLIVLKLKIIFFNLFCHQLKNGLIT